METLKELFEQLDYWEQYSPKELWWKYVESS